MNPSSQSYTPSSQTYTPSPSQLGYPSIQQNFNQVHSFQQSSFLQPDPSHSLHQGTDPNSPEVFRQNIQIVQDTVIRLQNLARNALTGIQNAYQPGVNPAQTKADIEAVKQTINMLADMMRQTGVGALPLMLQPTTNAPTEQQMMTDTTEGMKVLYERLQKSQESAAVVANLLGAAEHGARGGK